MPWRAAVAKVEAEIGTAATILVNNAGNAGPTGQFTMKPFWEEDPSEWDKFLKTNLFGVLNCCHATIPAMVAAGRGRLVTVVSDSGRVGEPRLAVYAAAKAGANGFVKSIAKEVGRYGITCNAVSLSSLMPDMPAEKLEEVMATDRAKAQLSRYIIRRYGKSEDVAALVTFLCSDAASWITGQTYPLNGRLRDGVTASVRRGPFLLIHRHPELVFRIHPASCSGALIGVQRHRRSLDARDGARGRMDAETSSA